MKDKRNILTQVLRGVKAGLRELQNRKLCALLLSAMIVGIVTLSPAFSSLMNSIVVNNTGRISTTEVTAESGSPSDIQRAVNAIVAAGGGTVHIPAGNWTFNPTFQGDGVTLTYTNVPINIIGAGMDVTNLTETQNGGVSSYMFHRKWNGQTYTAASVRISGITFVGYVTNETVTNDLGVAIDCTKDWRVDHCKFLDFVGSAIGTSDSTGGTYHLLNTGVIDHCIFDNPYKARMPSVGSTWGYGINVGGDVYQWQNTSDLLGQFDNPNVTSTVVYIENNVFTRMRHAITSSTDGYYIARYNTISSEIPTIYGCIDVHGFNYGRGAEVYNNTIYGNNTAVGCWMRGGVNTIFNNTFINCTYGVQVFNESAPQYQVQDTYIWSNTMVGGGTAFGDGSAGAYTQNVTYFLYARPNYTPYMYPHPLTFQTTP